MAATSFTPSKNNFQINCKERRYIKSIFGKHIVKLDSTYLNLIMLEKCFTDTQKYQELKLFLLMQLLKRLRSVSFDLNNILWHMFTKVRKWRPRLDKCTLDVAIDVTTTIFLSKSVKSLIF